MEKCGILLVLLVSVFLTACNNEFAELEYDSAEKIAQSGDRYAKEISVFNSIEGGYSFTVSKFDGRETLWTKSVKEAQTIEINFNFSLSAGQGKVVLVNGNGNVTTIIECTPESITNGFMTKTVTLTDGKNRLKFVGYDCEDVDLQMLFSISE